MRRKDVEVTDKEKIFATVNNQYGHTKIKLELKQSNQCKAKVGTSYEISTFVLDKLKFKKFSY